MAEKDVTEKYLENFNDVFSDIINVLVFGGKSMMSEDDLEDCTTQQIYHDTSDKTRGLDRDIAKYWKKGNVYIALCGLENQTRAEKYMPFRLIGYDGISYRDQLNKIKENGTIAPVATFVLYFGNERWNYSKNLKELLDIPDELKSYVNDYHMNVFEIAWLDEETVSKFKSDFRIVADFFVQQRIHHDYIPSKQEIQHVEATLNLLSAISNDSRFEIQEALLEKGVSVTMCEVLDKVENRGIEKGIEKERINAVRRMINAGILKEQIFLLGYTQDEYEKAENSLFMCEKK